jgi:hypothetical protein
MATYQDLVDELRGHPIEWLREERSRVVVEQRRLRLREVAITKVLDERQARDPMPEVSVPASTAKATVEVARALASTPALADAAAAGALSWEQLEPLTASRRRRRTGSGPSGARAARRSICRSWPAGSAR